METLSADDAAWANSLTAHNSAHIILVRLVRTISLTSEAGMSGTADVT